MSKTHNSTHLRSGLRILRGTNLLERLIIVPEFLETRMFQSLTCGHSVIRVVNEQFLNAVYGFRGYMRYKFGNASPILLGEVKLHVCGMLLELVKQFLRRCAQNVMDPMDLVKLVVAREQWKQG